MAQTQKPGGQENREKTKGTTHALGRVSVPRKGKVISLKAGECLCEFGSMGAKEALGVLGRHYRRVELTGKMVRYLDDSPAWHEPMEPYEVAEFYRSQPVSEGQVLEAIGACDKQDGLVRSLLTTLSKMEGFGNPESVREAARKALEEK